MTEFKVVVCGTRPGELKATPHRTMNKLILFFVLVIIAAQLQAGCGWTNTDTIYEATEAAVSYIDYRQTRNFLANGRMELNPFLGKFPSKPRLRNALLGRIWGHFAVSYMLPCKHRRKWQNMTLFVSTGFIIHNARHAKRPVFGFKIKF